MIDNNPIVLLDKVKDLGVLLDNVLSFKSQINNVLRITGYHLRNIALSESILMKTLQRNSCVTVSSAG